MPCSIPGHVHHWPTEGDLRIEGCERFCGYCPGARAEKVWNQLPNLKTHVITRHANSERDYPRVRVLTKDGRQSIRRRVGERGVRPCETQGEAPDRAPYGFWTGRQRPVESMSDSAVGPNSQTGPQLTPPLLAIQDSPPQLRSLAPRPPSIQGHPQQQTPSALQAPQLAIQGSPSWHIPVPRPPAFQPHPLPNAISAFSTPPPVSTNSTAPRTASTSPPSPAAATMIDIHRKLQLRSQVFEPFHLLIWRHLLSKVIPDLDILPRLVSLQTTTVPASLVNPIASFLTTYGSLLWPTSPLRRSHLKPHLNPSGSPTSTFPIFETDGRMTPQAFTMWRLSAEILTGHATGPTPEESLVYSEMGRLVSTYIFAMLQHSLVDPGAYQRAVMMDSAVLLHVVLAADEDEWVPGQMDVYLKPVCDVSGPLGDDWGDKPV